MKKREFLKKMGAAGIFSSSLLNSIQTLNAENANISAADLASDEDFWARVRSGYKLKTDYINLENGYYCFVPEQTLEKYINRIKKINLQGSWYMRNHRFEDNIDIRAKLATLTGTSKEEIILTRNTTESLDTIISGYDWRPGDEAIMAYQDYGAMQDMFAFQARRYGLVQKKLSVPNHPSNDDELVNLYAEAISPRTRLLLLSHMINITGHILPIRKIADMAHAKGVDVLVDGAHCVGHFEYSIPDLHCDYYGSSLHKWLSVPLGAGLLYVKKDKIKGLWQLFGDTGFKDDDIRKLNHIGTCPVHTDLAVHDAIEYYHMIGPARKEARLRYLQNYWTSKVRELPHIDLNTPAHPARSCGIANVGVKHLKPSELSKVLLDKYKIFTVAIDSLGVRGCRITPNVYTTTSELDIFVAALKELGA